MGKKLRGNAFTLSQSVRRSSKRLEEHILQRHSKSVEKLLDHQLTHNNISYSTYDRLKGAILSAQESSKLQAPVPPTSAFSAKEGASTVTPSLQGERDRSNCHLHTHFEELLEESMKSYEKSASVFRGPSLLERYGYLIDCTGHNELTAHRTAHMTAHNELTGYVCRILEEEEEQALLIVRKLYRSYKVSHMFKQNLLGKLKLRYVDRLLAKGYLKESKAGIVSLVC